MQLKKPPISSAYAISFDSTMFSHRNSSAHAIALDSTVFLHRISSEVEETQCFRIEFQVKSKMHENRVFRPSGFGAPIAAQILCIIYMSIPAFEI